MTDDTTHKCPSPECIERLPYHILACKNHWYEVPPDLRSAVNRTWRSGDTVAYLAAREAAVIAMGGRP